MCEFRLLHQSRLGMLVALLILSSSCGKSEEEVPDALEDDIANAVGEVMSSVDEVLSTQTTALALTTYRACFSASDPFGGCVALTGGGSSRVWNYGGCSVYQGAFSGSVTVNYSSSDCTLDSTGKTASRIPQMTIEGRNGDRTLTVSVDSGESGVVLTRGTGEGAYQLRVDGLRRMATRSGALVLNQRFDTLTNLTVSGGSRSGRTLSSGVFQITDALSGAQIELRPDALVWGATCTCAVSGSWVGTKTLSSGTESYLTIELTGCGEALVTEISGVTFTEAEVQLDRCISI